MTKPILSPELYSALCCQMADTGGKFLENQYGQFVKEMVVLYIKQHVGFLAFCHQPLVALIAPTLLIEGVFGVQNRSMCVIHKQFYYFLK
jgi:hypothetical protein